MLCHHCRNLPAELLFRWNNVIAPLCPACYKIYRDTLKEVAATDVE